MAKREESTITVAKITARQAVVVALITAVAGVLAGVMANRQITQTVASTERRYIEIEGIESRRYQLMRLVINVNGQNFSYPSTTIWVKAKELVPRERFLLPPDSTYRVSFRVLAMRQEGDTLYALDHLEFGSPAIHEHQASAAQRDQKYGVFTSAVRGGYPDVVIHYSVR